ncbi:dTDP-glucose 4,6-dehydratase [Streptomonospora arabica]
MLVTGGAGFIGSCFVRTLLGEGYPGLAGTRATVLDALAYSGIRANLDDVAADARLSFVKGDICDAALVDEVAPGHDLIVHFAAQSHVDRSILGAEEFARTNVLGTQVLLDAARRHRITRFVHVSTDEVYGSTASGSFTEQQPLAPSSPYSASKAGSDLLAQAYSCTHGQDVVITRCTNNYGPYQFPEKVIPRFVTNLLDGGTVPLYGDGRHVRDWLHVDDHCRAVALAAVYGQPGAVYNVGGGTELTNAELTARLLAACGAGWDRVRHVPDRKGHDRRYSLDDTRIRTELGYRPRTGFEDGLRSTVGWYRDHRNWWEPLKEGASQRSEPLARTTS